MLSKKIRTFHPSLTRVNLIGFFFVALIAAIGMSISVIILKRDIFYAIIILIIFTPFFYLLFLFILFFDSTINKKIIVFSNGISSFNKNTNNRIEMEFDEMTVAKLVKLSLGEKYIIIKSNNSEKELMIPCPIKDHDDFMSIVSELAGKNNVLVSTLIDSILESL